MRIKSKNVRPQIYLHMLQTMLRQLIKEARVGPVAKHILSGVGRVSGVEVEIRQIKFAALNFMKQVAVLVHGSVNAFDI